MIPAAIPAACAPGSLRSTATDNPAHYPVNASTRHVPAKIIAVPKIPYTFKVLPFFLRPNVSPEERLEIRLPE
jgi:hypothetical protein